MYQTSWTQPALNTLVLLRDHSIESIPRCSLALLKKIVDMTSTLDLAPERGRLLFETEFRRDIRECLFDDFRIIYRMHDHQVDTLTVIRSRKHLSRLGTKHKQNKPALF